MRKAREIQYAYAMVRRAEIEEFIKIVEKLIPFRAKDYEGSVGEPPIVCATLWDHPTDFKFIGLSKDKHIILKDVEGGDEEVVVAQNVEYGHLLYITDFLESVYEERERQKWYTQNNNK